MNQMENQIDVSNCLHQLRQLIHEHPDLHCPEDEEFLIKFLRAKDFKVAAAFKTLLNYVEIRRGFPNKFHPSAVKEALKSGMVNALKHRDLEGRHVFYFRTEMWNAKKINADETFIACTLVLEEMLNSVDTQNNGIAFLHNLNDLGISHCATLNLNCLKRIYRVKGGFPAKFKKAHALNPGRAFYILYSIAYPLIPAKILKRAQIYGKDLTNLFETLPRERLPKSLGGTLSETEAIDHDLINRLMEKDEYFKETSSVICKNIK